MQGLYWDNEKENGNRNNIIGLYSSESQIPAPRHLWSDDETGEAASSAWEITTKTESFQS